MSENHSFTPREKSQLADKLTRACEGGEWARAVTLYDIRQVIKFLREEVPSESGESQNVPLARNEVIVLSSEYHQLAKDARRYEWLRDNMRRMPMGEKGTRHFFDQADALSFQEAVDEATNAAPQTPASAIAPSGPLEAGRESAVAAPGISPDKSDQECWLIERFVNDHTEWFAGWNNDAHGLGAGPSTAWTLDAFKAVRFNRAEDARTVMENQGGRFHLAKPVAHLWFVPSATVPIWHSKLEGLWVKWTDGGMSDHGFACEVGKVIAEDVLRPKTR